MRIYADREINDSNMVSGTGTLSPYIRNLEDVADAARRLVDAHMGGRLIDRIPRLAKLADALGKLDGKDGE